LLFFFFSSSGSVGSFSPAAPTRSRVLEQLRLLIGLLGPLLEWQITSVLNNITVQSLDP
jgi:hypothetical protein